MKYLTKNRKDIELPSGAKIEVRKLNLFEMPFRKAAKSDSEYGVDLALYILSSKVGPLRFDGESCAIVSKPEDQLAKGEIRIEDLDQADAQMIVDAVIEFSGLNKAGQEARKTFPAGQESSGSTSPIGEAVRSASDGDRKAAA